MTAMEPAASDHVLDPRALAEMVVSTEVLFGEGASEQLPDIVDRLGARTMLITGATPRHQSLLDRLAEPAAVVTVRGEPTVALVRRGIHAARAGLVESVVAIGGGSVIDAGKAIAALARGASDPVEYLEGVGAGRQLGGPGLPMVAVPTTAGTGAEVTVNAVLTSTEHRRKASLRSPHLGPTVALIDPLLAAGCPASVTAASGMDALTQCLESFVSQRSTVFSDVFALEGLRHAGASLEQAVAVGGDAPARSRMALSSLFSGLALKHSNLGAVHGLAGVVGGLTGASHGAVCAALVAPTTRTNLAALSERAPDHPALLKYEQAAASILGDRTAAAESLVDWLAGIVDSFEMPTLGDMGLARADIPRVTAEAQRSSSMRGNPIELTAKELALILHNAVRRT